MTKIIKNYITEKQEKEIVDFIDLQRWNSSIKRRTQHYGAEYNYRSRRLNPAKAIPSELSLFPDHDQLIINEYTNNQSIAAHIDHTSLFNNEINIISLLDDFKI